MFTASGKFRSATYAFATSGWMGVPGFMVEPMTSLALDFFQPLLTAGILVLTVVKLVMFVVKFVQPSIAWLMENREDALRRTLVYFGIVVDDENDDE